MAKQDRNNDRNSYGAGFLWCPTPNKYGTMLNATGIEAEEKKFEKADRQDERKMCKICLGI